MNASWWTRRGGQAPFNRFSHHVTERVLSGLLILASSRCWKTCHLMNALEIYIKQFNHYSAFSKSDIVGIYHQHCIHCIIGGSSTTSQPVDVLAVASLAMLVLPGSHSCDRSSGISSLLLRLGYPYRCRFRSRLQSMRDLRPRGPVMQLNRSGVVKLQHTSVATLPVAPGE